MHMSIISLSFKFYFNLHGHTGYAACDKKLTKADKKGAINRVLTTLFLTICDLRSSVVLS